MHPHPLSRKSTILLAAAGVIIIALLSYAAVRNAHAHASSTQGADGTHTTLDKSSHSEVSAVPGAISLTQPAGDTSDSSTDVSAKNAQLPDISQAPNNSTVYSKPHGIEPADGDTPDPDTAKPGHPIIFPGPPTVTPPTPPSPTQCYYQLVHPDIHIVPGCGPYFCQRPIEGIEPNTAQPRMIACPVVYKSE